MYLIGYTIITRIFLSIFEKIMSVMLTGGCIKCHRTCSSDIDGYTVSKDNTSIKIELPSTEYVDLICTNCYEKYFSKKAIRNQKIDKLLTKKPWYKKLLKWN